MWKIRFKKGRSEHCSVLKQRVAVMMHTVTTVTDPDFLSVSIGFLLPNPVQMFQSGNLLPDVPRQQRLHVTTPHAYFCASL